MQLKTSTEVTVFLNNAAIAAQGFLEKGASKVAILDVDFHHGNGTQDIFYDRSDVLFLSLHGDPKQAFMMRILAKMCYIVKLFIAGRMQKFL